MLWRSCLLLPKSLSIPQPQQERWRLWCRVAVLPSSNCNYQWTRNWSYPSIQQTYAAQAEKKMAFDKLYCHWYLWLVWCSNAYRLLYILPWQGLANLSGKFQACRGSTPPPPNWYFVHRMNPDLYICVRFAYYWFSQLWYFDPTKCDPIAILLI